MIFLADENISSSVIRFLKSKGIDIKTLGEFGRSRASDKEIAEIAQKESRIILTLDLDFGYIYYFEKRGLINIVIIRPKINTPENITKLLSKFIDSGVEPEGLFVVTENKVRVFK